MLLASAQTPQDVGGLVDVTRVFPYRSTLSDVTSRNGRDPDSGAVLLVPAGAGTLVIEPVSAGASLVVEPLSRAGAAVSVRWSESDGVQVELARDGRLSEQVDVELLDDDPAGELAEYVRQWSADDRATHPLRVGLAVAEQLVGSRLPSPEAVGRARLVRLRPTPADQLRQRLRHLEGHPVFAEPLIIRLLAGQPRDGLRSIAQEAATIAARFGGVTEEPAVAESLAGLATASAADQRNLRRSLLDSVRDDRDRADELRRRSPAGAPLPAEFHDLDRRITAVTGVAAALERDAAAAAMGSLQAAVDLVEQAAMRSALADWRDPGYPVELARLAVMRAVERLATDGGRLDGRGRPTR